MTEFLPVFRVLYNSLHDKVQGKGCSHFLAIIETKEASVQFISSLVVPYHLYHFQFNPFWGRRDFVHLWGKSIHPQTCLHCLPFHRDFYSWKPPAQVTPLHQACREKNLDILPPHFSGLDDWNDAFGKQQNSYSWEIGTRINSSCLYFFVHVPTDECFRILFFLPLFYFFLFVGRRKYRQEYVS